MAFSPESHSTKSRPVHGWIARGHYFLGLYLLVFIWLFAVSGFLLNHSTWGMEDMQRSRNTTTTEHAVIPSQSGSPLGDARDLMRQLNLSGEVQWLATKADGSRFDFRVTRPGQNIEVRTNLTTRTATVARTQMNGLGITRALHAFTGVRLNDTRNERDWIMTKVWAFAMDAVALGLLVLVGSGIWVWLKSGENRLGGWLALGGGILVCGWFLFGIAAIAG